jgi:hypothetical protein
MERGRGRWRENGEKQREEKERGKERRERRGEEKEGERGRERERERERECWESANLDLRCCVAWMCYGKAAYFRLERTSYNSSKIYIESL